jgi:hypothetical protein
VRGIAAIAPSVVGSIAAQSAVSVSQLRPRHPAVVVVVDRTTKEQSACQNAFSPLAVEFPADFSDAVVIESPCPDGPNGLQLQGDDNLSNCPYCAHCVCAADAGRPNLIDAPLRHTAKRRY